LICGQPARRVGTVGRPPDYCGSKCREIAARRKKVKFRRLDQINADIERHRAEMSDPFYASLKSLDGKTAADQLADALAERDRLEAELFGSAP
jgi:hypothetical protein